MTFRRGKIGAERRNNKRLAGAALLAAREADSVENLAKLKT